MKPKVKVSISLSNELLDAIDREAKKTAESRSRIIELWLQLASRRRAARQLEEQTIAYYQNRSPAQREDDEAWGDLSARAAPASTVLREGPWHVRLRKGEAGIPSSSILKCEQITTLPKECLDPEALGRLSPARLNEVERAVFRAIGIATPE